MGEYGTGEYRNGAPKTVEIAPMPPNPNNPNPLEIPMPDQSKNQEDYSDDTAYLYSKNFSKATAEYALDALGKKYGLPHAGMAAITVSTSVHDYLQGDDLIDILTDNLYSSAIGKGSKKIAEQVGHTVNPDFIEILFTAGWDTFQNKK